MLIVSYVKSGNSNKKRIGGLGSTNTGAVHNPLLAMVAKLRDEHPMIALQLEGQTFEGMLDSGAQLP